MYLLLKRKYQKDKCCSELYPQARERLAADFTLTRWFVVDGGCVKGRWGILLLTVFVRSQLSVTVAQ